MNTTLTFTFVRMEYFVNVCWKKKKLKLTIICLHKNVLVLALFRAIFEVQEFRQWKFISETRRTWRNREKIFLVFYRGRREVFDMWQEKSLFLYDSLYLVEEMSHISGLFVLHIDDGIDHATDIFLFQFILVVVGFNYLKADSKTIDIENLCLLTRKYLYLGRPDNNFTRGWEIFTQFVFEPLERGRIWLSSNGSLIDW